MSSTGRDGHTGDLGNVSHAISAKRRAPKQHKTNLNSYFLELPPGMTASQFIAKQVKDTPHFVERYKEERKRVADENEKTKLLLLEKRAKMNIPPREKPVLFRSDFLPAHLPVRDVDIPKAKRMARPVHPELLVDGKPWRAPKLKKPKRWVTDKFYNLIMEKCTKQFGESTKRRRAEAFVVQFCKVITMAIRCKKNFEPHVQKAKRMLYKLGVIKTLNDFHVFTENYLPGEFRYKAIPTLRAHGVISGIQSDINKNLFDDLKL